MVKQLIFSLVLLVGIAAYAHAGFYVIPTVKEVEICTCQPTPAGAIAFLVNTSSFNFKTGEIYITDNDKIIAITGGDDYVRTIVDLTDGHPADNTFRIAPASLPKPPNGTKGSFYFVNKGKVCFANYL